MRHVNLHARIRAKLFRLRPGLGHRVGMDGVDAARVIADVPEAAGPHALAPVTVGEATAMILMAHPRAHLADRNEIEDLVRAVAACGDPTTTHRIVIGGRQDGTLGGPGTWVNVGSDVRPLHFSPHVPLLFPHDEPPRDPTVEARVLEELRVRVRALGGDPDEVRLIEVEMDLFARGGVVVRYATRACESGHGTITGFFAHVRAPYAPGTLAAFDRGAEEIVVHQRHGDEIRATMARLRDKAERRFAHIGCTVGAGRLLEAEPREDAVHVSVFFDLTMLGQSLDETTVALRMSEPYAKGEDSFDGYRRFARDQKRRLRILAGMAAADARAVCPVVARDWRGMKPEDASVKLGAARIAITGRSLENETNGQTAEFSDGRLVDTVALGPGVTFRNRTLLADGREMPESVLHALVGRPLTDLIDDERVEGVVVAKARVDSKGRLNVTTEPNPGVPLEPLLRGMDRALRKDGHDA